MDFRLSKDEAIVLFEFLSRIADDGDWDIQDSSEVRVLWRLQAVLEKILIEPFGEDYLDKVDAARTAVRLPDGTDAKLEKAIGRLALWLEPQDIAYIADQWRNASITDVASSQKIRTRVALRAKSALEKAGFDYQTLTRTDRDDET